MEKKDQNRVYVDMMTDALKKKEAILQFIYEKTKEQERILRENEPDVDAFEKTMQEKGERIDSLNEIDSGFDRLFGMMKDEIVKNREMYRESVHRMQELITSISALGASIQALESQNSTRFKGFLSKERKRIRDFNVNSRTASSYYQNMANVNRPEESHYFNEKK